MSRDNSGDVMSINMLLWHANQLALARPVSLYHFLPSRGFSLTAPVVSAWRMPAVSVINVQNKLRKCQELDNPYRTEKYKPTPSKCKFLSFMEPRQAWYVCHVSQMTHLKCLTPFAKPVRRNTFYSFWISTHAASIHLLWPTFKCIYLWEAKTGSATLTCWECVTVAGLHI